MRTRACTATACMGVCNVQTAQSTVRAVRCAYCVMCKARNMRWSESAICNGPSARYAACSALCSERRSTKLTCSVEKPNVSCQLGQPSPISGSTHLDSFNLLLQHLDFVQFALLLFPLLLQNRLRWGKTMGSLRVGCVVCVCACARAGACEKGGGSELSHRAACWAPGGRLPMCSHSQPQRPPLLHHRSEAPPEASHAAMPMTASLRYPPPQKR